MNKDGKNLFALKTYDTKIPSSISSVGKTVSEVINSLQNACGKLDDDILFDVRVILNELLLNAIKHGNQQCPEAYIKVTAGISGDNNAFFIIEDQGQGYDYELVRSRNKNQCCMESLFDAKETGRGIMIVESLCEKIKHNRKGNKIVAVKKISKD
ncbi:hypothetical protein CDQ84_10580 [Clostridium thermosuccinogenes]|uniref:Histidine kinase/HSP90-like ATPase domain-containing protein n=1 Tax=Clostridium thermosuccinogenes TaxID=84032 RepID=A0A2K2FDJ8_9CLOT|nr:hypothetical protein CDO33_17865 [Pseudoclostridium thermosuccinogenes]PNT91193.1 hypothetical protein CDQ83_15380 [Pseudoclostridium thermosuccinogenes]PNT96871.1 hypothetical protein CDQ85_10425 [Pseudoclostridium thermosuccinogenes]PNT98681.1 hypothetical protein CDQ84_10580 [Pseudoclostridium thermosuccinogenes]